MPCGDTPAYESQYLLAQPLGEASSERARVRRELCLGGEVRSPSGCVHRLGSYDHRCDTHLPEVASTLMLHLLVTLETLT